MGKKKRYKSCNFNKFSNFTIPPCAEFLGNNNPFVKDGKFIYKNLNRVYFFLTFNFITNGNLHIELYCFLIGLYINEIEKGNIKYDSKVSIHDDKNADKFIKEVMESNYNLNESFVPALTYTISNSNAILAFYTGVINISMTNFYIMLMLSRFYSD